MSAPAPVVIGVDIGTTATKVVAFDVTGRPVAEASRGYPLDEPSPGEAVQDPEVVVAAVVDALGEVARRSRDAGRPVAGISFSAAMHSLIALDAGDRPLTPSLTWADSRAAEQATHLRSLPSAAKLQAHTGTPLHPMAPLAKIMWFRQRRPELFARAARWVGIKELVVARLSGEWVVDQSIASGTGLHDLATGTWWPPALALAGIGPGQLPRLVPTTTVLAGRPQALGPLGLAGVPLVVGAGDGPLANLGAGAVAPGVAACSVGTSGALRVVVDRPAGDGAGRVFCYALTGDRWVAGGAVSNGGLVLDWAHRALAPDLPDATAVLALAATAPAGSDGLMMLPALVAERAPLGSGTAGGAYLGLERNHGRPHLLRAALEGVCLQLALVAGFVEAAGHPVTEIRATGGFLRDRFTRRLLTDVLGRPVGFASATEGSALGAALLGMVALGMLEGLEEAAALAPVTEPLLPDPAAAAVYREQRVAFDLAARVSPAYGPLSALPPPGP